MVYNNATNKYLGLKFLIRGKYHYGWARLSVAVYIPPLPRRHLILYGTLTGYAYETIVGKSIKAGQTKEADEPTNDFSPKAYLTTPIPDEPQPASLGMLALGAQRVPPWWRKESALKG